MTREKELIKKIKNGDSSAWNELINMYYADILRYCIWHTSSRMMAEDAVQETFLKAIRYFNQYSNTGKFRAFLYKIASNTCIDLQRKRSSTDVPLEDIKEEFSYIEQGYKTIEADMQMSSLVRELKEPLREVILLRFGQDLSLKEIADVTGLPLRTVQSRIRNALKLIREQTGKEAKYDN